MAHNVELTDTFGGEANYSWVRRATIADPDAPYMSRAYKATLMRRAKASVGMSGVRGVTYHHGDMSEFRPYGACIVLFVTYDDSSEAEV